MQLPSNAKLSEVIAKLQALTGINQIPDLKEALQAKKISLTGNETMVDLVQIVKDNNFAYTADATATASDIYPGKTAYVKGQKVTGTMPNKGAVTITPTAADQAIPAGYHNGSGIVKGVTVPTVKLVEGNTVAGQAGTLKDYSRAMLTAGGSNNTYVTAVGSKGNTSNGDIIIQPQTGYYDDGVNVGGEGSIRINDPNLNPANILSGKSIFGVVGNVLPYKYGFGSAVPEISSTTYKYKDSGTKTAYKTTVTHNLGWTPAFIILFYYSSARDVDREFTIWMRWDSYPVFNDVPWLYITDGTARLDPNDPNVYVNSTGFSLPYTSNTRGTIYWKAYGNGQS
ncbi:hypothetical protein BCV73_32925 [Paenibacillus sp. SSG-1]|uniref:hypothetical protein n=1 Tax=Paenibacillus sp. SSG-1 TaxID=1443669 RepID=UPI000B7C90A6|nr:hypothetical protein [Paenibacillus sp. SSG-1]OXL87337.1 hypothetical protein BCV73_32925 [Paenibacillus sp. SSG-1]